MSDSVKRLKTLFAVLVLALAAGTSASGQTSEGAAQAPVKADASVTPNRVLGEVMSVDAAAKRVTVKTDGGATVTVAVDDKTVYLRTQPGATSLDDAARITLADLSAGDRVIARGKVAEDRGSVAARQLIVMTKADIAEKQKRDREEWQRRGIVGVVTALNPETKEISLQTRSLTDAPTITVEAGSGGVKFRRYAPDSIKFSDAKPSSFAELKVGDQLRAKGERSADGARFTPEEIVSGTFRTLRGSVTEVNPEKNEIKVKDLKSGQAVMVAVSRDTMLRRIPAEFVARMTARAQGGPGADGGSSGGAQPTPSGADQRRPSSGPDGERWGGRRRAGGGFDFQQMLERMPAVTVTELKPGDMIIVSSTAGADPSRMTAITLVAGVDALLRQAPGRGRGPGATLGLPEGALDPGIGIP